MAVTVVIPTYNRANYLPAAVQSVLSQTWSDFELIIVDDGSDDGTKELVAGFLRDKRVRYLRQENRGASAARNAGIKAACREFIAFLDSDDRFVPEKLMVQLSAMRRHPDFLVSHTQEIWYRRGRLLNQKMKHAKGHGDIFSRCLALCAVGMSTIMAKRELFDKIGLFDENLPCCEDYDLWLTTSAAHQFLLIDQPLTIKHGGRADQLSWQYRVGMDRFRIKSIHRLMKTGSLTEPQWVQAARELIKKCTIYGKGCLKHNKKSEGEKYLQLAAQTGEMLMKSRS